MTAMAVDLHTSQAEGWRRTKAIDLTRYLWDLSLTRLTCCHFGLISFAGLRGRWAFIRRIRRKPGMSQRGCWSRRDGGRRRAS